MTENTVAGNSDLENSVRTLELIKGLSVLAIPIQWIIESILFTVNKGEVPINIPLNLLSNIVFMATYFYSDHQINRLTDPKSDS